MKEPIDLVSSHNKIRKTVCLKNQYVTQQACYAYIATLSQLEVAFDLSFTAHIIISKIKDVITLNKCLHW